ncbi:hypothetical protein Zmor_027373 [Zophobas morio]|uniref:Carboxylic ester hydrolase n=1 Tax=Zophobas morio TaxID=2755281 RepID=A0AA38M2H3_9CUCU|nr:hypothetical protein Zmor_027373 [Zophobas morio]
MSKTHLFWLLPFVVHICAQQPVVQTPLGSIKGSFRKSIQNRTFSSFEGIPYAKPPIGDLRFEPPEPREPWDGIWDANHPSFCAQTNTFNSDINGDEDCLHVNVYVPRENPNPDDKLDVMVHIHGGAYMYASGQFFANPVVLMDKELVLVSLNYRLGILGFLSTEDDVVSGNNGLKDQVLALKWVQENIASFGGNPESVTIHGISAGGGSVHFHYLSEMSKGLFHKGYSQSGVAANTFSIQEGALEKAKILANAVGCPVSDTTILVKCLKQRHHRQLLSQMGLFFGYSTIPISPFAPVVEKGSNPFLKEHPYELLKKGKVNDLPWISSNVADEGHLLDMFLPKDVFDFNTDWQRFGPILLDFNYTIGSSLWSSTWERIKNFYFDDKAINAENFDILCNMYGDRTFTVDAQNVARIQASVTKSPVYYYYFRYKKEDDKYVSHGVDSKYLFGPTIIAPDALTEDELLLRNIFLDMFISFAKTGTPSVQGVDWKPTKDDKLTYLDIKGPRTEDISLKEVDELAPLKFWQFLEKLEQSARIDL